MRHQKSGRKFNRDTNARKALFVGLAKNLIEREQITTTLPKAKDLRGVVEKMITRAKTDSVANRRLAASELGNDAAAVKKLFTVLGPRYAKRPGGYTRVLHAGFRYGDAAPMAVIEFVDRDVTAKKNVGANNHSPKSAGANAIHPVSDAEPAGADKAALKSARATRAPAAGTVANSEKMAHGGGAPRAAKATKEVAVKRRATGK